MSKGRSKGAEEEPAGIDLVVEVFLLPVDKNCVIMQALHGLTAKTARSRQQSPFLPLCCGGLLLLRPTSLEGVHDDVQSSNSLGWDAII